MHVGFIGRIPEFKDKLVHTCSTKRRGKLLLNSTGFYLKGKHIQQTELAV